MAFSRFDLQRVRSTRWLAYASDERDLTFAQTIYASMHIPNCTTARALGLAPAYRGQQGYRAHLDRDGDGIACEPYRRR